MTDSESEPGLPPGSRPPSADEVAELLGDSEPDVAWEPPPSGAARWGIAGGLACAAAGLGALWLGWEPSPGLKGLSAWQAVIFEGGALGLGSGAAFGWWSGVQGGRTDPVTGTFVLGAGLALYLVVASFLLEQALGTSDPLTTNQRAAVSLQLSAVLLASLLGYLKARGWPLRPLLGGAGAAFLSSSLAQILAEPVGGGLEPATGLPYGFALPLAWTLAELWGPSPLRTAAD